MNRYHFITLGLLAFSMEWANALGKTIPGPGNGGGGSSSSKSSSSSSKASSSSSSKASSSSSSSAATSSSSSSSSISSSSSSQSGGSGSAVINKITSIAANSTCAAYNWEDRGRAPKGYMKGMALTYARSLCRLDDPNSNTRSPASLMSRAQSGDTNKDALSHYQSSFNNQGLEINVAGPETLRSIYTLGIGLAMKESSGEYCEGWDVAAGSNRDSSEAEAGLFQASYNSMGASAELRKLYDEYRADPSRCFLDVFKEGVSCKARGILGSGAGAEYQQFTKSCPAFAAEYAITLLRILRKHFGPINRREAELIKSCNKMLDDVQTYVDSNGATACNAVQ